MTRKPISEAITVMTTLNRDASAVFGQAGAHALTDVTGFGLLGHLRGMAAASGVSAQVWTDLVPILPAARDYVQQGIGPGGTHANLSSSRAGSATTRRSPSTSSSCFATLRLRADCSQRCPETAPHRLCVTCDPREPAPPP